MWPFSLLIRSNALSVGREKLPGADIVSQRIEAWLHRQHTDATAKEQETWKWGPVGSQVRRATRACENILLPLPKQNDLKAYFARVQPLLADLANRYRHDDGDADGFGLGTVREIEEIVRSMAPQATSPTESKR